MHARYTVVLRDIMRNEITKTELENALSTYPLYEPKKTYDLIPTREQLNTKLLNHYKYREIGFETVGRFVDELEITMNEIMPFYNEMFKTIETMADLPNPFDNVDVTETFEQESTGTSTQNGTSSNNQTINSNQNGTTTQSGTSSQSGTNNVQNTGTSKDETTETSSTENEENSTSSNNQTSNGKTVKSDTPQDSLGIGSKNIDGVSYASEAEWREDVGTSDTENSGTSSQDTETSSTTNRTNSETVVGTNSNEEETEMSSESSSTSNSESNETGTTKVDSETSGTVKHTFTKKGNQGVNTYAHDMNEFRTSIIDVVDMIINDMRLQQLFMGVF